MSESNIFGLSIRGIIAFIIVMALCWACLYQINDIKVGTLKDLCLIVLGFYFGQRQTGSTNNGGQNVQQDTKILSKPVSEQDSKNV